MAELKQEWHNKHKSANADLIAAASKFVDQPGITQVFKDIAKMVGVTNTTISNYVAGDGKDGFLTQTITKAFKQYKKAK